MRDLRVGNNAYVIESKHSLLSTERVSIEMNPGCVWIPLFLKDERVGLVFAGSSHFAVDAITETDEGAIGESISGTFGGIQVYLGQSDLASVSREAVDQDILPIGHSNTAELVTAARAAVERELDRSKFGRDVIEGDVLIGKDSEGKTMVLLLKGDNTVFTYGKIVYVVGDDGVINVGEKGLAVGGRRGRTLIVRKDGKLVGLERLDSLPGIIETAVREAVEGISGRGNRRRHVRMIDDFDEDHPRHPHRPNDEHTHDSDIDDEDLDSV